MIMKLLLLAWIGVLTSQWMRMGTPRNVKLTTMNRIDLETGEKTLLSKHAAPVRSIAYSPKFCESLNPCD